MLFEKFEQIQTYNNIQGVIDVQPILIDIESISYLQPMCIIDEEGNVIKRYTKAYLKNVNNNVNLNIDFDDILKKFSI